MTNNNNDFAIPTTTSGVYADGTLTAHAVLVCVGMTITLTLGALPSTIITLLDEAGAYVCEFTLGELSQHQIDAFHVVELYAAALEAHRLAVRCERQHGQHSFPFEADFAL